MEDCEVEDEGAAADHGEDNGAGDEEVLAVTDTGHIEDLLGEGFGGVFFGEGAAVGLVAGEIGVTGDIGPGGGGGLVAGAYAGLDGPGSEGHGGEERRDTDGGERGDDEVVDGFGRGDIWAAGEEGAEAGAGERDDKAGLGVGQLNVFEDVALLGPGELGSVADESAVDGWGGGVLRAVFRIFGGEGREPLVKALVRAKRWRRG